jgi:5-hydroxyisourate hydrolase
MAQLTTHILDIMSGKPAAGVTVELFALDGKDRELLAMAVTNQDGRCEKPLLAESAFGAGTYELVFHVGDHFAAGSAATSEPPFLDVVPVRFCVAAAERDYHVPLLVSAYGYSTYRGS